MTEQLTEQQIRMFCLGKAIEAGMGRAGSAATYVTAFAAELEAYVRDGTLSEEAARAWKSRG